MKIRFLMSIADTSGWSYDYNQVVDLPDAGAREFLKPRKRADGSIFYIAEEVNGKTCPQCGYTILDDSEALEAATLAPSGERATLPRASKR